MVVAEVGEETFEHIPLLVVEIGNVVKLVYVLEIAENLVGIGHVLVDVVEVGQEELSPTIEVVERLGETSTFNERLVKVAYKLNGVAHLQVGVSAEQVANGNVGRAPHRLLCVACQMLVHEESGTLVGEHHSHPREVGSPFVYDVLGDILQESLC